MYSWSLLFCGTTDSKKCNNNNKSEAKYESLMQVLVSSVWDCETSALRRTERTAIILIMNCYTYAIITESMVWSQVCLWIDIQFRTYALFICQSCALRVVSVMATDGSDGTDGICTMRATHVTHVRPTANLHVGCAPELCPWALPLPNTSRQLTLGLLFSLTILLTLVFGIACYDSYYSLWPLIIIISETHFLSFFTFL